MTNPIVSRNYLHSSAASEHSSDERTKNNYRNKRDVVDQESAAPKRKGAPVVDHSFERHGFLLGCVKPWAAVIKELNESEIRA